MMEVIIYAEGRNYIVTEQARGYEDLVNGRVFDTWQDAQYTLLALSRCSRYALEHGLACPADTRNAVRKIKTLPRR